jgi:pimeloyl-ACP methyl ester carboxylesterase
MGQGEPELVVFAVAGHFPFVEQPAAFTETVRDFLNLGSEQPR